MGWGVLGGLGSGFQQLGDIFGPNLQNANMEAAAEKRREQEAQFRVAAEKRAGEQHTRAGVLHGLTVDSTKQSMDFAKAQEGRLGYAHGRDQLDDKYADAAREYGSHKGPLDQTAIDRLSAINPQLVTKAQDGTSVVNRSVLYPGESLAKLEMAEAEAARAQILLQNAPEFEKARLREVKTAADANVARLSEAIAGERRQNQAYEVTELQLKDAREPTARALKDQAVSMAVDRTTAMLNNYLKTAGDVDSTSRAQLYEDIKPIARHAATLWADRIIALGGALGTPNERQKLIERLTATLGVAAGSDQRLTFFQNLLNSKEADSGSVQPTPGVAFGTDRRLPGK